MRTKDSRELIRRWWPSIGVMAIASVLSACGDGDLSDLESYVAGVESREAAPLFTLPRIRMSQHAPAPSTRVDPFRPFFEPPEPVADPGPRPDPHAPQELEHYALDALRMVGIVEFSGEMRALVRAPDGVVHRVSPGNYLGLNAGKVTFIDETGMELREIIADRQGQWIERDAKLALNR